MHSCDHQPGLLWAQAMHQACALLDAAVCTEAGCKQAVLLPVHVSQCHAPGMQGMERHRDPKGEVAKNFRVKGFVGSVSFVTSMTQAFCGDCNRLRLMADGNLKAGLAATLILPH